MAYYVLQTNQEPSSIIRKINTYTYTYEAY